MIQNWATIFIDSTVRRRPEKTDDRKKKIILSGEKKNIVGSRVGTMAQRSYEATRDPIYLKTSNNQRLGSAIDTVL